MTQGSLGGHWSRDPVFHQLRVGRPWASHNENWCPHVMQMSVNTREVLLPIKPGSHCVAHSLCSPLSVPWLTSWFSAASILLRE